jgi:hypothetical protein
VNINKVYANVRLAVPDATLVEINRYLLAEIDAINATGIESIRRYSVSYPSEDDYGSPDGRIDGQGFNYYPGERCFVLPSSISLIERVYIDGSELSEMTLQELVSGITVPGRYYVTNSGEMYFSSDIANGSKITISGRFGGHDADTLSDKYIPFLTNSIIAGLTSHEYKDPDAYAIYSRKAEASRAVTENRVVQTKFMKRNGRLY